MRHDGKTRGEAILFWDVDTQVDFMLPGGALYVPHAEWIVPNLKRLTDWAVRHDVTIVASADAHRLGDPELSHYPPHCLVGTPGQRKIPETLLRDAQVVPNHPVPGLEVRSSRQIILEKQELDVFSNPNVDAVLTQIGPVREVFLYGVVTELCVARAGRGLMKRGYRLHIITDAIRHLDPEQAEIFLREMSDAGATLVTTAEVLAGATVPMT